MTTDGEGGGEKSKFRWLDAARYAVAAAVTVLIMVVIVNAVKVVLRPDSLQLSVDKGSIFTAQYPPQLIMELKLRAQNPSGRVRMYYVGVTGYLFDNSRRRRRWIQDTIPSSSSSRKTWPWSSRRHWTAA